MVALAALVRLPYAAAVGLGVAMILLHDLADAVAPAALGALAPLWLLLHQPGPLLATGDHIVFVAYPLVPWIGVMAVGFGLGRVITWPAERRSAFLLRLGLALVAAFLALRLLDGYGDPNHWTPQGSAGRTVLSFLNTTKYPPSLLFLLMTLGPALVVLRLLDGVAGSTVARSGDAALPAMLRPVLVFGRVPLFYYLLHVALLHSLALVVSAVRFHAVHWVFQSPTLDHFPITQPPGWPLPLPAVYALWVLVVALAYPCCRRFAALKARRRDAWLSYL
jgi:uncharacterized membrane protein